MEPRHRPGLFEEPELHDTTLEMAPDEVLFVFTDGLVEARHASDMFGSERAADILHRHGHLPADELATLITDAARAFHGDHLTDDLALLLLKQHRGQDAPPPPTTIPAGPS